MAEESLNFCLYDIGWDIIKGIDFHIDPIIALLIKIVFYDRCSAAVAYPQQSADMISVIESILQEQGFLNLISGILYKTIIVISEHPQIHIIIPRDKSLMTHRTESGTGD